MARRTDLRASDSDRERVAERLRSAAAEGRLLTEELEERLATALRARTHGELDAVVADLPRAQVSRRRSLPQIRPAPALALVLALPIAIAVVVAVLAVVFAMLTAWTVLAAIVWMMVGHRRRWYGPRWYYGGRRIGPPRGAGIYRTRRAADPRSGSWS